MNWFPRLVLVLAGLLGAGGVAAAAAAAHGNDEHLFGALALVALTHAPVLVAFGLAPPPRIPLRVSGLVIGAGAYLFAADLAARHFAGRGLFPYSAPLGGTVMIAGWLGIAVAGAFGRAANAPSP